jgi:hypothetical protein
MVFVSETRRRRWERRMAVECTLFDESWKLNKNVCGKSIVRRYLESTQDDLCVKETVNKILNIFKN